MSSTLILDRLRALRDLRVQAAGHVDYVNDPVGFTNRVLGEETWSKQNEVQQSVLEHPRTAVKSCHSAGKSFVAARLAAWWLSAHQPGEAGVVSTAPSFPQVRAILWKEISRAHKKGDLPGRINQTEWFINDEIVGSGRKPADWNPDAFQGFHARYVLVIIDEACGVPKTIFDAAESLASNEYARILAIGNPDDPTSEFAKVCDPGSGWNTIRIDGYETPNFTDEQISESLSELLISPAWVEDKKRRWGEDSPLFISKVRGEFPEDTEDSLIAPSWVAAARRRDLTPKPGDPSVLGCDIARFGASETVLILRHGPRARIHSAKGKQSTTRTAGLITKAMRDTAADVANVDGVGVGGGVVDMLRENGIPVNDLNGGAAPQDKERFKDARAEWFWHLRERFRTDSIDIDPDDDELAAQLTSMRWDIDSKGRIVVESKDDMRARGVDSPDRADGLAYAFAPDRRRKWGAS